METRGEDQRRLRVPRDACAALPTALGDHGVWRPDVTSLTDPDGREEVRAWVQVSTVKEPSCARSQDRILRGAPGPQDIQGITALSPGRPWQGWGNEPPTPACLSGVLAGVGLILRGEKSG